MPTSPWSEDPKLRDVGLYCYVSISSDIEGLVQFMYGNILGWTQEQISVYAAHALRELKDMSIHGYCHWQVVYGQKPE